MKKQEKIAVVGGTIVTPTKLIHDGLVLVEKGKIKLVGQKKEDHVPSDFDMINAEDMLVLPGFIDLHVNGGGGTGVMDGNFESINTISIAHARHGVTAILPATISAPDQSIFNGLKGIAEAAKKGTDGARVLGAYLEGPFLGMEKRGAHNPKYLQPLSFDKLSDYMKASDHLIKIVIISPELEGSSSFIRKTKALNVIVGIGHSVASYATTLRAIEDGISHASHVFNGMKHMESREPGAVGAVLLSEDVWAEVIADGFHVHPAMVDLLIRIKGVNKTILVTDAIRAAGSSVKSFELYGVEITVKEGRTFTKEGGLAGSILTLDKAVKNVHEWTKLPLYDVVRMASLNPAIELGVEKSKGSIEVWKDADLVIADKDVNVRDVIIEGTLLPKSP